MEAKPVNKRPRSAEPSSIKHVEEPEDPDPEDNEEHDALEALQDWADFEEERQERIRMAALYPGCDGYQPDDGFIDNADERCAPLNEEDDEAVTKDLVLSAKKFLGNDWSRNSKRACRMNLLVNDDFKEEDDEEEEDDEDDSFVPDDDSTDEESTDDEDDEEQ